MYRTRLLPTLALVFSVLLSACAPTALAGGGTATPVATTTPAATSTPTATSTATATATPVAGTDDGLVVTLADAGRTIDLKVGERFLLKLGDAYDWAVDIADPSIVSRVPNVMVVRGAQGLFEARQAGQTTLTAAGDPVCRKVQPPCAMPSIDFTITLVVH